MAGSDYEVLVSQIGDELIHAVKADVTAHYAAVIDKADDVYGYAIQTPEYTFLDQPIIVYNREADLSEEEKEDTYYRYSVDEWKHYDNDALPKTTAITSKLDARFREIRNNNEEIDGHEFRKKVYDCFTRALQCLAAEGFFSEGIFLVVWPREERVILESAKLLNPPDVFAEFEADFG